jgi:hypothetical protein
MDVHPKFTTVTVDRAELERLRAIEAKVKSALTQTGDDVCWRDLYNPEVAALVGVEFDPALLPKPRFLGNCGHFYDCLATGTPDATPDAWRLIAHPDGGLSSARRGHAGGGTVQ